MTNIETSSAIHAILHKRENPYDEWDTMQAIDALGRQYGITVDPEPIEETPEQPTDTPQS